MPEDGLLSIIFILTHQEKNALVSL